MFSAIGPERRVDALAFEFAVDRVPVEIEEGQRFEPVGDRIDEQAAQRGLGDGPPAESGDHRVDRLRTVAQGHAHVARDDAADAHGEALLHHDHPPDMAQRIADLGDREGAEAR